MSACFADQTPINQRGVVQFFFDGAMDEELTVDQGEEVSLHASLYKLCWHTLCASACSTLHASLGANLCQLPPCRPALSGRPFSSTPLCIKFCMPVA